MNCTNHERRGNGPSIGGACPHPRCGQGSPGRAIQVPGRRFCCSVECLTYRRTRTGRFTYAWELAGPRTEDSAITCQCEPEDTPAECECGYSRCSGCNPEDLLPHPDDSRYE